MKFLLDWDDIVLPCFTLLLPEGNAVLPPKPRSGKQRKTSTKTYALIRRAVMKHPSITSCQTKKLYPELLKNGAERTILIASAAI